MNFRIQMTVSVTRNEREGVQSQKLFPLYVFLARLVPSVVALEYNATYRFSRACMLSSSIGVDGSGQHQANFILPDINKLAMEARSSSLVILLVSFVGAQNPLRGINLSKGPMDMISSPGNTNLSSPDKGMCLLPKIWIWSIWCFPIATKTKRITSEDFGVMGLRYGSSNISMGATVMPFSVKDDLPRKAWLLIKMGSLTAGVQYEPES